MKTEENQKNRNSAVEYLKTSSFFSHQDPAIVEWFVKMEEERKGK